MWETVQVSLEDRLQDWFTARNALAELREQSHCEGYPEVGACEHEHFDDIAACDECGVHAEIFEAMVDCIDAATAFIATYVCRQRNG